MLERTAAANDRHDSVRDPYQTIDLSGLTPLLPYDLVVDFDPVEKRQVLNTNYAACLGMI